MVSTCRVAILTALICSTAFTLSANAETIGAEMASKLLARSQALDSKCRFLDASQRDQLLGFVSKAEVALVSKSSVETSKSTFAAGHAEGLAASCSETEKTEMLSILAAASEASAAATPVVNPVVAVATTEPQFATKSLKIKGALSQYAAITAKYYLALRLMK